MIAVPRVSAKALDANARSAKFAHCVRYNQALSEGPLRASELSRVFD